MFTYQPIDKDMALDGWSVSKMFPKQDGHYVMVYKRVPNNDNFGGLKFNKKVANGVKSMEINNNLNQQIS